MHSSNHSVSFLLYSSPPHTIPLTLLLTVFLPARVPTPTTGCSGQILDRICPVTLPKLFLRKLPEPLSMGCPFPPPFLPSWLLPAHLRAASSARAHLVDKLPGEAILLILGHIRRHSWSLLELPPPRRATLAQRTVLALVSGRGAGTGHFEKNQWGLYVNTRGCLVLNQTTLDSSKPLLSTQPW